MALSSHTGKKIVQKLTVTWLWTITVAQDLEKLEQMLMIVAILLLQLPIHFVVIHNPPLVIKECDHEHANVVCLATGLKNFNTKKTIQWYYEFIYCDLTRNSGQCSGDTCCIDPATGENIGTGYCQVRVPDYDPADPGKTPPTPNPNPQHPDGTKDICYDVKLSDDAGWDGTVDTEAQQANIKAVDDYFCSHMDSLNFGPTQDEVISPSENGGLGDCRK